jgi:hypothetical protein
MILVIGLKLQVDFHHQMTVASQFHERLRDDDSLHPAFKTPFGLVLGEFVEYFHEAFDHHVLGMFAIFEVSHTDGQKFPRIGFVQVALCCAVAA